MRRPAPVTAAPGRARRQAALPSEGTRLTADAVLQLQRNAGNQAVGRLLAPPTAKASAADTGGLMPDLGDDPDVDVGGGRVARTVGEQVGDFFRPIGAGIGNVVGGIAAALTGIDIDSSTVTGPAWNPHGHFRWEIGFTTTGRSGWIVQEVTSTRRAQDAAGADVNTPITPKYWEAWAVDHAGVVTPGGGVNDTWQRRQFGTNTHGHWSIYGKCYFTKTDPATQGFTPGGAPEAGILLSTTSAPSGLGIARLHRYAQGTWDSRGATPTHTGRAGP